jgi:hypothetical protein
MEAIPFQTSFLDKSSKPNDLMIKMKSPEEGNLRTESGRY